MAASFWRNSREIAAVSRARLVFANESTVTDSVIGILIALIVTTIPLVAVAKRLNISYPVVLIVAGLFLGFVPGLPEIRLDPNLVLLIFLPPLLYWESITAPTDVMLDNAGTDRSPCNRASSSRRP